MKPIYRIKGWLAFRLFNLWHTIGFLFQPFLTIGVCLILTVLLNALLLLVMRWLPETSALYNLIYALITGVTASFFASICIEFSNNYRNNRLRLLELSGYFNAIEDFEMKKGIWMHPESADLGEDVEAIDPVQAVWYSLPALMPVIQQTYDEKKAFLSYREMESMKQILHMFQCIKRDIQIELRSELGSDIHEVPIASVPDQLKVLLSPEYLSSLRDQEYDRVIHEMVDRIFADVNSLKSAMDDWIPVGERYLDENPSRQHTSSLLSICCRSILEEIEELEKPILKEPISGYLLRRKKEAFSEQIPKETKMNKTWRKTVVIGLATVLVTAVGIFLLAGVPLIINAAYLNGGKFKTAWTAEDVLSYYGTVLSFAGTVVLGIIAVWQTRKANNLSRRMLELEETRNVPMVDLCQINGIPSDLPNGIYQNALTAAIDGCHLAMKEDNTILHSDGDVLAFMLRNVSDTYVTSLEIPSIQYVAYKNGQAVNAQSTNAETSGGIRTFAAGETQYLLLTGIDTSLDPGDLPEEETRKKMLELELTFLLGNTQGKRFRETIHVCYYPARERNDILYPHIFRKDPIKVEHER